MLSLPGLWLSSVSNSWVHWQYTCWLATQFFVKLMVSEKVLRKKIPTGFSIPSFSFVNNVIDDEKTHTNESKQPPDYLSLKQVHFWCLNIYLCKQIRDDVGCKESKSSDVVFHHSLHSFLQSSWGFYYFKEHILLLFSSCSQDGVSIDKVSLDKYCVISRWTNEILCKNSMRDRSSWYKRCLCIKELKRRFSRFFTCISWSSPTFLSIYNFVHEFSCYAKLVVSLVSTQTLVVQWETWLKVSDCHLKISRTASNETTYFMLTVCFNSCVHVSLLSFLSLFNKEVVCKVK